MYFPIQSQKSKPAKYAVFRDKTLTICNQSPTCCGPSGPLSSLCYIQVCKCQVSVIMKFVYNQLF